ncbi:MAG: protein kinase domain-containing protein [Gemmatimonadota bacterium]
MNVTASDWRSISQLLDEGLDLGPGERANWLKRLASTQPGLAPLVRELLEAHAARETADVLERLPQLDELPPAGDGGLAPGERIGPYRLKRELGAGGMALVWLAERVDGAFTRDVALKLPQFSRLRRDLAARFARERDILARLEHPHIARLYDAGVSADGLPYLALEYVEGEPITAFCDRHALDLRGRLRLFAQVLDAVQYAHAHLVIHRDVKPSNVLVTKDGQVRLLDFGIARLLADDEGSSATQLTQLAGRALTPDYASPEQIRGESLTIASDIYSLGVLLFELLTGSKPYSLKLGSIAQLEQAILEAEPARPSAMAVSQTAAAARATTPRRLQRALAGDLDTIVLKALRKSPDLRYSTSAALADDLQRHLAGRAVLARPDSAWYRARKWLARHRFGAAAAAVAAFAVVGGSAVALWQAHLARQEAQLAQREALHAQTVQRFLLDIFRANSTDQADPQKARATTARELLDIGARRAADSLKDAPAVQEEVLGTLADMYAQMKLDERAAALQRQRLAAVRRAYGERDVRVADALVSLAADLDNTQARGEIGRLLDEAEGILDAAGDRSSPTRGALLIQRAEWYRYVSLDKMRTAADQAVRLFRQHYPDRSDLLHALRLAALSRLLVGDPAAAEPLLRELVEASQRRFPDSVAWQTTPLVHLAETEERLAKIDEAETYYRRAWELSRRINGEFNADALQTQAKLGYLLHHTGRRAEGRKLLFDALHALGRVPGNDAPNTVGLINITLGTSLTLEGRIEEAGKYLAAEADDLRQHYPRSSPLARALIEQAKLATALGRYDDARALLDESDSIAQDVSPNAPAFARNLSRFTRAQLLLALGRAREALTVLDEVVVPPFEKEMPLPTTEVTTGLLQAHAFLELGQGADARAAAQRALDLLQRSSARKYFGAFEADADLTLGAAIGCRADPRAAHDDLEQAYRLYRQLDDRNSLELAASEVSLAGCLADLGQVAPAKQLLAAAQRIHAFHVAFGPVAPHFLAPLRALQRRLSG